MKYHRSKTVKTTHGSVKTPFFMPDATRGFVKFLSNREVKSTGVGVILVNTLHLYLQPGMKLIKKAGSVHKFINWDGPILSDSGGFQVFSLIHSNPKMGKIYDNGAIFKSPIDGSKHVLTPEKSIQIQFDLGVDMMVCLDDCPPNEFKHRDLEKSVERTIAWAKKCKREYDKQVSKRKLKGTEKPWLFAVIQGGEELDLRKKCAEELLKLDLCGYGFGGRPVDKNNKFLGKVLKYTADLIPDDKLKFALGIGTPEDIVRCVRMGWDMFDCVIPTREGRHGRLFLWKRNSPGLAKRSGAGKSQITNHKQISMTKFQIPKLYSTINIINSKFARDFSVINENSKIPELKGHTKAYLHHLFKLKDPLGARLASLNNLEFYIDLFK